MYDKASQGWWCVSRSKVVNLKPWVQSPGPPKKKKKKKERQSIPELSWNAITESKSLNFK
jgi:hypothetical protein